LIRCAMETDEELDGLSPLVQAVGHSAPAASRVVADYPLLSRCDPDWDCTAGDLHFRIVITPGNHAGPLMRGWRSV